MFIFQEARVVWKFGATSAAVSRLAKLGLVFEFIP